MKGVIVAVTALLALPAMAQDLVIPFEIHNEGHLILVEAEVNGKNAVLILDTGAGRTVLSPGLLGQRALDVKLARFADRGPGLRVEALPGEATVRLGTKTWRAHRVTVMSLDEVSQVYGRKIDGLLGQDLLLDFDRVSIDFRARRILLAHEAKKETLASAGAEVSHP